MKFILPILMLLLSCSNPSSSENSKLMENNPAANFSSVKYNGNPTTPKGEPADIIILSDSSFTQSYRFEYPTQTLALGLSLLEISGITFYPPKNQIVAINDERGILYFLNPATGKVEDNMSFSGNGDYEGVAWIENDKIAVTSSRGHIYIYNVREKKRERTIKTELDRSNDVEGLVFRADKNQVLLACKGSPNLDKDDKYKKLKNIFRYDFDKEKLKKKPFLSVEDKDLEDFVEEHVEDMDFSKKDKKKLEKRAKDFSPSGIAIHPLTEDLYLLSSHGKTIIIFDKKENLKSIIFLDEGQHRQPEGICFLPNGDLFISNEGRGLGAKLMRYNFLRK